MGDRPFAKLLEKGEKDVGGGRFAGAIRVCRLERALEFIWKKIGRPVPPVSCPKRSRVFPLQSPKRPLPRRLRVKQGLGDNALRPIGRVPFLEQLSRTKRRQSLLEPPLSLPAAKAAVQTGEEVLIAWIPPSVGTRYKGALGPAKHAPPFG